jgi:hypothetical protein
MTAAYNHAVSEARYEYGADAYNGTISTTSGCVRANTVPMTEAAAGLYADSRWASTQKWGPAIAVPIAADERFSYRRATFTVTVPSVYDDGAPRLVRTYDVRDAAVEEALRRHDAGTVHTVEVLPAIKNKVVVTNARGTAKTRYMVVTRNYTRPEFYETKARAVAAAKVILDRGDETSVRIRAVKVYPDDGDDAARVSIATSSATAKVTVTLLTPKVALPATTGWVFFGTAAE